MFEMAVLLLQIQMYLSHNHGFFFRMNLTEVICEIVITISILSIKFCYVFLFYFRITKFTWTYFNLFTHKVVCRGPFNKHKQIKNYFIKPCII